MDPTERQHVKSWSGFRRWLLLSVLCAVAMPLIAASFPEHVGKGSYATQYHHDPYDTLRMLLFFAALFVSGAAFGSAIGVLVGDQTTCAVVGIFLWPVLLFFALPVVSPWFSH